jgi:hypothetical protein
MNKPLSLFSEAYSGPVHLLLSLLLKLVDPSGVSAINADREHSST